MDGPLLPSRKNESGQGKAAELSTAHPRATAFVREQWLPGRSPGLFPIGLSLLFMAHRCLLINRRSFIPVALLSAFLAPTFLLTPFHVPSTSAPPSCPSPCLLCCLPDGRGAWAARLSSACSCTGLPVPFAKPAQTGTLPSRKQVDCRPLPFISTSSGQEKRKSRSSR